MEKQKKIYTKTLSNCVTDNVCDIVFMKKNYVKTKKEEIDVEEK